MEQIQSPNPNTIERMNQHYEKFNPDSERFNDWMMPKLLEVVPKKGKILEVGCGFGRTLHELKNHTGAILHGIELSPIAVEKAVNHYSGIIFEVADCEDMTYDREYDLVICSQTLEHVDNPKICIARMMKAVKKGGYIFITVPWPGSNLDRGVKLHHWTFYPEDYKEWLPGCQVIQETPRHMVVIYKK